VPAVTRESLQDTIIVLSQEQDELLERHSVGNVRNSLTTR